MSFIEDFKNDYYINKLTRNNLIEKYKQYGITEHTYKKIKKELNLSRPISTKFSRLCKDFNIEIIQENENFIEHIKEKPKIKQIPNDMKNLIINKDVVDINLIKENSTVSTRKAMANKKIKEHIERNDNKTRKQSIDLLSDYSGIVEIVNDTNLLDEKSNKMKQKIKKK